MLDGDLPRPRLLAIDDDLALAELITRAAERCGYEARAVDTPSDLPKLLDNFIPDVITLDLSMPDEDGLGLLQVLEQRGFLGPLVIVSGHQDWLRKAACRLAAGRGLNVANDFRKPVDLTELRRALQELKPDGGTLS
jgi:CheY-like chemotaxis protein